MLDDFLITFIARLLDDINNNESVRNFVKSWGEMFANLIPGEEIEPQLIEFLDLFKEGVLQNKEKRENEEKPIQP